MTKNAYCKACGMPINAQAKSCPDCGAPQGQERSGNLALFAAILSAFAGYFALAIVFGPIAAVSGFYAYQRQDDWLQYLAAASCGVGVVWTLVQSYHIYTVLG